MERNGQDDLIEQDVPSISNHSMDERTDKDTLLSPSPSEAALQEPSSLLHTGDTSVKRHLVEMLSQRDIDHRIMQKGVRVTYVGEEFSNINYLVRCRARNHAVYHFPSNQIPRCYTSHDLERIPSEAFILPSPEMAEELLSQYFRHVNPGFPILDEARFMGQFRGKDSNNPPSLLVLQAALMVGAHVSRDRTDRDELKATYFRRAKLLFDSRFEWNGDGMIQAALLMTWYSEGVEDVGANSYHWIGLAVRTAFGMGMHRDCRPSTLVVGDKRLWRRLWWILLQFDVMVAISYGRPMAINLDEADVPPLSKDDFEDAVTSLDEGDAEAGIDFVMYHTRLCCIMAKVIRERYGPRVTPEIRKNALRKAGHLLAEWQISLPPGLRHGSAYRSSWSAMLHISYSNILILLHRPAPQPSNCGSNVSHEDVEICSLAGSSMVGLFESLWRRGQLSHLNVFAVNALFTGMIQLSAEMRVTNPILAANAMRRYDTAQDVLRSLAEYWFNADMTLRLFEDSSEDVRDDLRIGRASNQGQSSPTIITSKQATTLYPTSRSPGDPTEVSDLHGALDWQNILQANIPSKGVTLPEQRECDWNALYWENSGFAEINDLDATMSVGLADMQSTDLPHRTEFDALRDEIT